MGASRLRPLRVNPDFAEIELKDVRESATRLAIMQAAKAISPPSTGRCCQDAIDDGLE